MKETLEKIELTSSAFEQGGTIPKKHTCDGADVSPALKWGAVPKGTRSLALILEDPDAPRGTWVHWVIFNLPPTINNVPEGMPPIAQLANGERHGKNDFGKLGYGGPCPPSGTHRYSFRIYALDTVLTLESGTAKKDVAKAMEGHLLAKGELVGRYGR